MTNERTLEYQIDAVLDKFDSELKQLKSLVAPINKLSVEEREKYCRELILTSVVVECSEAVMDQNFDVLNRAKQRYSTEAKDDDVTRGTNNRHRHQRPSDVSHLEESL